MYAEGRYSCTPRAVATIAGLQSRPAATGADFGQRPQQAPRYDAEAAAAEACADAGREATRWQLSAAAEMRRGADQPTAAVDFITGRRRAIRVMSRDAG